MNDGLRKALLTNDWSAVREIMISKIRAERERQIKTCQHGGDTENFDKQNTQNDWVAYITAYAGRAAAKCRRNCDEDFFNNMVIVAALALAAMEAKVKAYC